MNLEKYDKAIASYLLTLEYEGPSPDLYCHIGAAYEKTGQYEIGLRYYTKASKIDSLYHQAWFGVGTCFAFKENWLEATHFFKKAIKIDPLNTSYLKSLAESEYSLGNSVSSIEIYEQLCQLEPVNAAVWLDWSSIYYDQGDYQKALNIIEMGLSDTPDRSDYLYRKTVYLLAYGKYKEAMVILEQALILNYEGHVQVYNFFEDLTIQKALFKIIDKYRKDDQ
jgi:tetratricopeptide (TPR) repeat protein